MQLDYSSILFSIAQTQQFIYCNYLSLGAFLIVSPTSSHLQAKGLPATVVSLPK